MRPYRFKTLRARLTALLVFPVVIILPDAGLLEAIVHKPETLPGVVRVNITQT